jgi:hypothetical protein
LSGGVLSGGVLSGGILSPSGFMGGFPVSLPDPLSGGGAFLVDVGLPQPIVAKANPTAINNASSFFTGDPSFRGEAWSVHLPLAPLTRGCIAYDAPFRSLFPEFLSNRKVCGSMDWKLKRAMNLV